MVAGFSHEYLRYMQGGFYRGSFRPLNDAIIAGRIRGLAGVVGCNNARVPQDEGIINLVKELIANDVLVVVTGCAAHASGKHGFLTPEMMMSAGPGLREVCEAIGIPPVLHLGSCVDNTRILTVLTQVATEGGLGEDIDDIPGVGICPEYMCEKAIAIGTYCVASGVYILFGVGSPVEASEEVTRLISEGWEKKVGGKLEFYKDWTTILEKSLEHIDKKRAALDLAVYDPTRFGQSGDVPLVPFFATPPEERNLYSRKAYCGGQINVPLHRHPGSTRSQPDRPRVRRLAAKGAGRSLDPTKRSNSPTPPTSCPPSWATPAWRSATLAG